MGSMTGRQVRSMGSMTGRQVSLRRDTRSRYKLHDVVMPGG